MNIKADTALEAVNAGEATIEGLTTTDSHGYQYVIVNNHNHARVDHVECAQKPGEESDVERIANIGERHVFEADGRVADEKAEEWFGEPILVSGACDKETCEMLGANRAWKILNQLNCAGEAYVCDDESGFHVSILAN